MRFGILVPYPGDKSHLSKSVGDDFDVTPKSGPLYLTQVSYFSIFLRMLDEIVNNAELTKYHTTFKPGQIIFLEGDNSQDLYVMVSGQVDVFKGDKKIRELTKKGSIFGEVSFLLGDKRTASVRAKNDVKVIRIPREEITPFLCDFPSAGRAITKHLAQWLDETSQILHGLKELCDQLPDAVILTDKQGQILTWNSAAEKLFGREWQQLRHKNVDEIYQEPAVYKNFLKEVLSQYSVREKIFKIKHPDKGPRFISTSMTVLYDGHHNFQGVLSLGRDVTEVKNLERKYKRIGYWLISSFLLVGFLTAALFLGYSYFSKGFQTVELREQELKNYLAKDFFLLKSLLIEHLRRGSRLQTSQVMANFFQIQQTAAFPYTGLVLLDMNKKVFDAYSNRSDADVAAMIDSSYAGIEFKGDERSPHKVLTLYRPDKNYPMGKRGLEIAFELRQRDELLGWLIFQMDMDQLNKIYGLDAKALTELHF